MGAEFLWTGGLRLRGREFCSLLNQVIRDDLRHEIAAAAPIIRAINQRRMLRNATTTMAEQQWPANGELWRGGGFDDKHKAFFSGLCGHKYRVPGFPATSQLRTTASSFAFKAAKDKPRAMWHIRLD